MMSISDEDLLRLDAGHFQDLFEKGTLTVAALTARVVQQIEKENTNGLGLRAIIYVTPESQLRARADILDHELRSGHSRGHLHGIPVVLKDCIATDPNLGLPTSAGSFALLEDKILKNAPLVERLLENGAIIIGKGNLSEFCAFKGENLIDGFSPGGGQTISPYIYGDIELDERDLSPSSRRLFDRQCGERPAGFALIGIGTENDGSIVQPSSRQALYSMKPTREHGTAEGCWRVSTSLDTVGAMARSARDVAATTEILLPPAARERLPPSGYSSFLTQSFVGLKIGFVDPTEWRFPPDLWVPSDEAKEQHDAAYHNAKNLIESLGAKVVYPVSLTKPSELEVDGEYTPLIVNSFEIADTAKTFFDEYVTPDSSIRDLGAVVSFNEEHSERCLPKGAPDQSYLVKSINEKPSQEKYEKAFQHMIKVGREEGLAKTLRDNGLDIVVAPMDSPVCSLGTASGYPIVNVPLGRYRLKGQLSRPFGLAALASSQGEGVLFQFMSAYEASVAERDVPERLLKSAEHPERGTEEL